jgi:hypothetical protein
MDCEQVKEKYKDYLLAKLTLGETESIGEHILDCTECFRLDRREKGLFLHEYPEHEKSEVLSNQTTKKRGGG